MELVIKVMDLVRTMVLVITVMDIVIRVMEIRVMEPVTKTMLLLSLK